MQSLDNFAQGKLRSLDEQGLRRRLFESDRPSPTRVRRAGRELISFCCNDYLNLSHHPEVVEAARQAVSRYGAGAGASRLVTGNHPLFARLEARLAALKGAEDCVVFGSGYLANLGVIPTLCGPGDLVVADALSHACLLAGARLSGAETVRFRHNDITHAAQILATRRRDHRHCLLVTDGVFSMDGDLAPLPDLARLAQNHDTWLMTDDAHGIGVLGAGRGSAFVWDAPVEIPLQMGTLSKAIGSYGGYLCASRAVADLLRTRARTLIYSTGLPPAAAAASLAALDVIERDPALSARAVEKARQFAHALGMDTPRSPIVPLVLGTADAALAASAFLESEGYLVTAIRPPTVPDGTARLRFTFTAAHETRDIERMAGLVRAHVLPPLASA